MSELSGATAAELIRAYHDRTKHQLERYAAGPGTLDWDAQPDPFRRWLDTATVTLPRRAGELATSWDALAEPRRAATTPAAPFDLDHLGTLLQLCAAITAWKSYGGSRWALRAHPSSGNLHPTETYVMARGVAGLADGLYHYQARDHSLELRADAGPAGPAGLWLGFSSIHWREAWKYGERAFRYCQLDLGHVLAAVSYAAALLGWQPRLLPLATADIAARLGVDRAADFVGVEGEEAEAMLALLPASEPALPPAWGAWHGRPSLLDPRPLYQWPVIEAVAVASRGAVPVVVLEGVGEAWNGAGRAIDDPHPGPLPPAGEGAHAPHPSPLPGGEGASPPAAQVILKRRSAQAFDGVSVMPQAVFRRLLAGLLPGAAPVWGLWPYPARVHPVLLVHRVEGLAAGVYALPRASAAEAGLRQAMRESFEWAPADPALPLFRLVAARAGNVARTLSCHQDIATADAVTFMLVAEFAAPVAENPAAYRHLHWEAGMLGHVLTLEAEAAGWRGTGIGCFFDDAGHEVLGLADARYQVIYHFAVGMAVDDPRLTTLPAYGS